MKQSIGGYEFDALTREEAREDLKESLGHHFSQMMREWYRGIKLIKLPIISATAGGTTLALPNSEGAMPLSVGPAQGYLWKVTRVVVSSSGTDAGAVSLYAGSDPLNPTSATLIDATLAVNKAYYPGGDGLFLFPGEQLFAGITSVSGNIYRLTGLAVEVPSEMSGKILGG